MKVSNLPRLMYLNIRQQLHVNVPQNNLFLNTDSTVSLLEFRRSHHPPLPRLATHNVN